MARSCPAAPEWQRGTALLWCARVLAILKVVLASSLSLGIHGYVWWRLVRRSKLPKPWDAIATVTMVVMFIAILLTTRLRNVMPELGTTVGWIAFPWLALVGLTAVALAAIDLGRLLIRLGRRVAGTPPPEVSPDRRRFLARVTGGAALTMASSSVAVGMVSARGTHEVTTVEVTLPKLPTALDGFTIVQLSDLHVGLTIDRAFVQKVVDRTNALAPDVIALTGDLVDGQVPDLRDDFAPLGSLRAKHGVFSVTGNHEYYSGADPWIAEQRRLGIRVLRNERVAIGDGEASFDLAGVDDHAAGGNGHGEDIGRAVAGRDPARALVLLAHQPRQVKRAARHGVDLQLSGHTHGGQIWPWHYLVKVQQGGLLAGLYRIGQTQLYVTRGCGYWGPPVRLLAPLEITRIVLRSS